MWGIACLSWMRLFRGAASWALLLSTTVTLFAQNPNSDTTSTGQVLTVHITAPDSGQIFPGPPPCEVPVAGLVTLSSVADTALNLFYVLDLSGSTADITVFPPVDVTGDGRVDAADDLNGDGFAGDILDAEIAGALALHASIHNLNEVSVGVVGYASAAAVADVSPAPGFQNLTAPPRADEQPNGVEDVEEVLKSMDSRVLQGGSIDLFTPITRDSLGNSTNFEAALQTVLAAAEAAPAGRKTLVYFLSDGRNETGGTIDDEIAGAAELGITINTVGITEGSDPTDLRTIAEGTGGTFVQVNNPADLRVTLPNIPVAEITDFTVNGQPVALSSAGTFATTLTLAGGPAEILATAVADDGTTVTAGLPVFCVAPLACDAQIVSPNDGSAVCGDSVEVTVTTEVSGGLPPITAACTINGVPATEEEGMFTAKIPVNTGDNPITAVCTFTDALGSQVVCEAGVDVVRAAPPRCGLEILSPVDSSVVFNDSVQVTGFIEKFGGQAPLTTACEVNGVPVPLTDSLFTVSLPCEQGENILVAQCTVEDSCGQQTVCSDTVRVFCVQPLTCDLEILEPQALAQLCGDSVQVRAVSRVRGGLAPYTRDCTINGVVPEVVDDTLLVATVPITAGHDTIAVTCSVTDALGNRAVCADQVAVFRLPVPTCHAEILSPPNGFATTADSTEVTGRLVILNGIGRLEVECLVNEVSASHSFLDSLFSAKVPLAPGENTIAAVCRVTDRCGSTGVCTDTVMVTREAPIDLALDFQTPVEGEFVCGDSVQVTAVTRITGGVPAFTVQCDINGRAATLTDSVITATVPVTENETVIVVNCSVEDAVGNQAARSDTLRVFRDAIPPSCSFTDNGTVATGTFVDNESGIGSVEAANLRNAVLVVEPFTPGDKTVSFRVEAVDPAKPKGFSINVADLCGNTFNCDPILFTLSTDGDAREVAFTFPAIDRYLEITNHGLTEIRLDLNGHAFAFFVDPQRVARDMNAFHLPAEGQVTVDLQPYLQEGENNLTVGFAGPVGSFAQLMLIDVVERVDFVLDLQALPEAFALAQNYPNPFNPTTRIVYEIPRHRTEGVRVQLRVYNLLGELVRTLVDEPKQPGRYVATWDGRDERGAPVSSGIYIYQMVAGSFKAARRLVLLR